MKRVIYLDELFLLNFALAAVLLLAAGLVCGARCAPGRLVAAAGLGGCAALMLLAPPMPFALALAYKGIAGALQTALCYGVRLPRRLAALCCWYLLLNLLLTGVVSALALHTPAAQSANLAVYIQLGPGVLLAAAALVWAALRAVAACFGVPRPHTARIPAVLHIGGAALPLTLYWDSGFTMQDPIGRREVVLVRYEAARVLLPAALAGALQAVFVPGAPAPPQGLGLRLVQCRTVAGAALLPALPAECISCTCRGRQYKSGPVLAVFCARQPDAGWDALAGTALAARLLGGRGFI